MRTDVRRDKEASDRRFLDVVWPIVRRENPSFRGFQLMDEAEARELEIMLKLDRDSNIDFWAESGDGRRLAIANRVQCGRPYRTFTIRLSRATGMPTEMAKMTRAVKDGYLHAGYQLHSYLRADDVGWDIFLRSFGVLVDPLYRFIGEHPDLVTERFVYDGNRMAVIEVDDLRAHGIAVDEVDHGDGLGPWKEMRPGVWCREGHTYIEDVT